MRERSWAEIEGRWEDQTVTWQDADPDGGQPPADSATAEQEDSRVHD